MGDRVRPRSLGVEDGDMEGVVGPFDRQAAGVDANRVAVRCDRSFVSVTMEDVVVAARLGQRLTEHPVGAVIDRDVNAVDGEFAALAEIRSKVVDNVAQRPLAVVVAANRRKLEGVGVERRRRKRGDDVATMNDVVDAF